MSMGDDGDQLPRTLAEWERGMRRIAHEEASGRAGGDFESYWMYREAYIAEVLAELTEEIAQKERQHVWVSPSIIQAVQWWRGELERFRPPVEMSGIVIAERKSTNGLLIAAQVSAWSALCRYLGEDWRRAYGIPAEKWEEIVAGAFHVEGFEVTLTPRSRDYGRDVIATKGGVGSVKIIGSMKAYKPELRVGYDSIRALLGVMAGERDTSKGVMITTSDFPPRVHEDPYIAPFLPYRLELLNGVGLRNWLKQLSK